MLTGWWLFDVAFNFNFNSNMLDPHTFSKTDE